MLGSVLDSGVNEDDQTTALSTGRSQYRRWERYLDDNFSKMGVIYPFKQMSPEDLPYASLCPIACGYKVTE